MTHEEAWQSIDRHFADRLSVGGEAALRAHLPGCAVCAKRYEQHLVLARIDPRAPSAQERLARGLGMRAAPRVARPAWWAAATVALAAAFLVLVPARAVRERGGPDMSTRGARGAGELWVYRFQNGAAPRLATHELSADDELAFAYANPAAKPFVAIFGADEQGHVYWYYPAWPVGTPAPASVPARAGSGPHELPEAVRHEIEGRRIDLYAVFSDERVGVAALEAAVARRTSGSDLPTSSTTIVVRRSFEVVR